ncbi:MAG: transglycosylase domain-containing protein [Verrucomicrobiales bacterium]|nr:transglycosylase domain-containing protein [Verrucomicrobiales bacterium]
MTSKLLAIAGLITGAVVAGLIGVHYKEAMAFDLVILERPLPSIRVEDARGKVIGGLGAKNWIGIGSEEIPLSFRNALIAAEDARFYHHSGFDPEGMARAAIANVMKGEIDQGASTITQQLARNAYPLGGRSWKRKLTELCLAWRIERHFTKDEILTRYANRIYFGRGFYGLGAASHGYFGKAPLYLDNSEAATLAGLIRSPNALSPWNNPKASLANRDRVIDRMQEESLISVEDAKLVKESALPTRLPADHSVRQHHLLISIERELETLLGNTDGSSLLVSTSVDLELQRSAELALRLGLEELRRSLGTGFDGAGGTNPVNASAFMIENATGRVITSVPSADQDRDHFDRIRRSLRSLGMAFSPLVYGAAYEAGLADPSSRLLDVPLDNKKVMLGGMEGILGEWGTESMTNRYEGEIPSALCLIKGKQSATARLGYRVGIERLARTAARAGVSTELKPFPATFLGGSEISLHDLVLSFTAFANGGKRPQSSSVIDEVRLASGELVYRRERETTERVAVFSEHTSNQMASLLRSALSYRLEEIGHPQMSGLIGGMTGTSVHYKDNVFVGSNEQFTWAVWFGRDLPAPIGDKVFASDTVLPVWASLGRSIENQKVTEGIAGNSGLILTENSNTQSASYLPDLNSFTEMVAGSSQSQNTGRKNFIVPDVPVHGGGRDPYRKRFSTEKNPSGQIESADLEAETASETVATSMDRKSPS